MKRLARLLIRTLLSGIIISLVFSHCIEFNIDPVFGSIYDHARPDVRQRVIRNLENTCEKLELVSEYPNFELEVDESVDLEEIKKVCQKELSGRELFIEYFKTQMDNIRFSLKEGPGPSRYLRLLNLPSENFILSIIILIVLLVLLFFVEENYLVFLKDIGRLLLSTSIFLILIYFLPKIMMYFLDIDTSFLLDMNQETRFLFSEEVFLVLLPIILEIMIKDCMLWYSLPMFGVYMGITIFRYFKKK